MGPIPMMQILRFVSSHPLTRDHKLQACFRVLNWQLRSRLKSEIYMPWIAGTKLVVKRGMTGATGNVYAGLHEFVDMSFLLHFLRPTDLFIDAGANVGSYTVLASGVCKSRSISFEPASETSMHLRANIKANALENLVVVHEVALGANVGTVRFTVGLDTTNRVAKPGNHQNTRLVAQARLDDILADENPNLIKVDVEGYEEEVLKGAERILSNRSLVASN
ncbi:MAG: FkbM family methyltransferase [Gammaproteobacteria bacterium]